MFFRTVRFKILVILILFSLSAMGVVLVTVYRTSYALLRTNEMSYNVEATSRTKESFEFVLDTVYKTAKGLLENADIYNALRSDVIEDSPEATTLKNTMSSLLKASIYPSQYIAGIHVAGARPVKFFSSIPSVDEDILRSLAAPYFEDTGASRQPNSFTGRKQIVYYPGVTKTVIQYLCPVYNIVDGSIVGLVIIDIDYGMLEEMFLISSMKNEDKALIVRSNGDIIFNYPYNVTLDSVLRDYPQLLTQSETQFSGEVFGAEMLIVSDTIAYTDWHIIRMISMARITKDTRSIQELMGRVALIFSGISIFLSIVISRILTAPITRLTQAFQRAERGDLRASVSITTRDEMGNLGESFNGMMKKLNQYFHQELELRQKKNDMELEVLQAQVNPHFLYNTLDSIKWLAMLQSVNNIAEMTTALINLLKYNLSKEGLLVTLSDEVESVVNYIKVQKYRYGTGFDLKLELSPDTLNMHMLRFLLQPLVENCILHAFGQMEDPGTITIQSFAKNEVLHIKVIDNGEGMDVTLVQPVEEEKGTRFKNIGINNIRERIKLHYGQSYGLSYQSEPNKGTTAELTLPVSIPNSP